jgi:hypothetical protein
MRTTTDVVVARRVASNRALFAPILSFAKLQSSSIFQA